ncbi:MAG: hypothetical protein OEM02_16500 [Desulfobulbaceae bacterium]|nr:hypothetical protein [Desulfobulbaceae bacterium]
MAKKLTKSQIVSILGLGFLVGATSAQASTVGNPTATTPSGAFQIGLDIESHERDYTDDDNFTSTAESNRYQARAAFGITSNIELFVKGGMASLTSDDMDQDLDDGAVFGGGIKATVLDSGKLKVGVVAQVLSQTNEYSETTSGYYAGYYANVDYTVEVSLLETELALGASYQAGDRFTPYAGIMYSNVDVDLDETMNVTVPGYGSTSNSGSASAESADNFGVFVGTDIHITDAFGISIEGRFVHESSFSALANFTL